jgi:hypothetical protein
VVAVMNAMRRRDAGTPRRRQAAAGDVLRRASRRGMSGVRAAAARLTPGDDLP